MEPRPHRRALPAEAVFIVGCGAIAFGSFGLALITVQRIVLDQLPHPPDAAAFMSMMRDFHRVWWMHLPIWIGLGALLAWQGRRMRHGVRGAGHGAAALAFAAMVELADYCIDGALIAGPAFERQFEKLRFPLPIDVHTWVVASCVIVASVGCVVLAALGWTAWRWERSGAPGRP